MGTTVRTMWSWATSKAPAVCAIGDHATEQHQHDGGKHDRTLRGPNTQFGFLKFDDEQGGKQHTVQAKRPEPAPDTQHEVRQVFGLFLAWLFWGERWQVSSGKRNVALPGYRVLIGSREIANQLPLTRRRMVFLL